MNRRIFLSRAAILSAPLLALPRAIGKALQENVAAGPADIHAIDAGAAQRIQKALSAAMAMQRRDWEQGILAQALLEAGDRERVILLSKAAAVQKMPDGRMGVVVSGGATDPAMGGEAYAKAAEWAADSQLRQCVDGLLEWIRHKAPRSADGVLYHVLDAPQMWSDGFSGAPPFLAAMGLYDEALAQIDGYWQRLWNPEHRLLAHIWDEGKLGFADGSFWGGGNGWAAAGLARVLHNLPADRTRDRERLAEFARKIIDGCLAHQRSDGLFHDVVDRPSSFVETNLAQMLAYAAYEGVAQGWLPRNYLGHADRMRAAARAKMDGFGFVQGVCSAPNFDRAGISTEGQAFCIRMEVAGAMAAATSRRN
jgi:rhamnogalacturonyl hydrolase YesR